jgi:predicted acylesterase/phospholipase RssA/CRP-like cAMP-binding protein
MAPATLDAVAGAMERLELDAGTILVRQGDPAASLFLVLEGLLASSVRADDGPTEQELGSSGPGDVIGEVAVLTGTQRTATVRSVTASVVAALAAEELWRLAADHPDLIDQLLATSVRRLRRGQFATYLATLLGPLDTDLLDAVEPRVDWTTLRGGEILFGPDDAPDALFVVLAGRLRVIGAGDDHAAASTLDLGRGTHVGLTSVLTGRPQRATVVAVRDTELAGIDRPTLRWLTETYPAAGFALMERLADQLDDPLAPAVPAQGGAATFALLGHQGVDAASFGRRLGATLARHGRTLVVTARDAATIGATAVNRVPLHHWLEEREAAHDFVMYVTRGYAHIGVIRAMEELGIPVDMVGGTSSGAIAGAAVARGWSADRMEQTMTRFGRGLLDPTLPLVSVASGGRLWRALDESFGDGLGIEDLWLPFFSVATDLTSAASVVHRAGPLARALRASLSLPGILPPVSMDGHLLIDGGLLDNLPIGVMRRRNGGGRVIAVDVSPRTDRSAASELPPAISGWRVLASRIRRPRSPSAVPGIVDILSRTVAVAGLHFEREHGRDAADLLLQPPVSSFGTLDFANVRVIAEAGYRPSLDALRAWWANQPGRL